MEERRAYDNMEDRRMHNRMSKLEEAMNSHFIEHTQFVEALTISIKNVETAGEKMAISMSEIAAILKIYNDTKGFVSVMKVAGATLLWTAAIGGSMAAVGTAIKFWIKS